MFHVRTVYIDQPRAEDAAYELAPNNPEGQAICSLFSQFLSGRPPEFCEKLPLLRRDLELNWRAAPGGVALASFSTASKSISKAILLAGVDPEADRVLLEAWCDTVAGEISGEHAELFQNLPPRPLVLNLVYPNETEIAPSLQLIVVALASVYFRCTTTVRTRPATAIE